ncbi:MAG TPA: prolyl oligopeptidase family serine peptidase [Candidatus Syntrophosphaera sp.]|nr:prolyl oligopeptidase family serine peptidase [Candidatus Syntrophosphaera sp.]
MQYPRTRKDGTIDEFFGVKVPDPYRWLENDHDPEVIAWTQAQQALTESILNQYPGRKAMLERMQELVNYPRQTAPIKYGEWYYYHRNDGLQNQWVIYRKRQDGPEELFLDPNTMSPDGTTTVYSVGKSKDFRYFTFLVSAAGADAGELWTIDTITREWLPDKLKDMRHTGAEWYRDGFFYSRYLPTQDGVQGDPGQNVWYHKLGTPQEEDVLVYEDAVNPRRFRGCWVSDDGKYLFMYERGTSPGNRVLYRPADDPKLPFKVLFDGFEHDYYPFDSFEEDCFYLFTNKDAPNHRLVKFHLDHPEEEHWQEVIPERDYRLDSASPVGGKLIAIFTRDVCSRVEVLDTDGKFLREIQMPYQGTAGIGFGKKEDPEAYFYFSSYVRPGEIFRYDIPGDSFTHYHTDPVQADLSAIVSEQVFYPSKDGTLIPMTLIHRNDIPRDGKAPVLLYGYGGFDIALMPSFSTARICLLEKGFICAVANLRGGGEYGKHWHDAGKLLNKQNVFDDFIAAAEYLIREGYTNHEMLAINGGSNGGLLVGACLTQRPDLFRAAVPAMGVLDMLRFHKFTCGWNWMADYGNPDEEQHFRNLLSYSPLHNIKEGTRYPDTMVLTADHDDRVVPGHSFKFAATMQDKADPGGMALLYTQTSSAHGPSSLAKSLEYTADTYSFICMCLGV